jgi:hypothetical protein
MYIGYRNENIGMWSPIIGLSEDFCSIILKLHMIEILHFKMGAKIIKLNAAVTNLNVP